jgi:hypothetical protein
LLNIEEDEAGKLRSFRQKFGRGWDAEAVEYGEEVCAAFRKVDWCWFVEANV